MYSYIVIYIYHNPSRNIFVHYGGVRVIMGVKKKPHPFSYSVPLFRGFQPAEVQDFATNHKGNQDRCFDDNG